MGSNQTKENVIVNENLSNVAQVESKLNIIGIVMLIFVAFVLTLLIYALKRRCTKGVRKWLRKEIVAGSITLPSIKVETLQPHTTTGIPSANKVVF